MGSKSSPPAPVCGYSPDAVPIDSSVHLVLFKCGLSHLRWRSSGCLSLPRGAPRRFSCCAHTVWNSIPSFVVCTNDSFTSFRSQLKTYNVHKTFVAGPLSVPLTPFNRSFARYKFVTCLLQETAEDRFFTSPFWDSSGFAQLLFDWLT